ncbi:MAG: DNA polymerase III subunit delta' C-terminal domain-containing protein, partial [Oscillospiraceae bacterium]
YIFDGKSGVGRYTTAQAFAHDFIGIESDYHPDIITVTNQLYDDTKKQTNLLVDTIRCMKKDVYIKPYSAEHKFYIIPNADSMNIEAQNSILKVFEEPPGYCTIILISENLNLFLPTIISRATTIHFQPLPTMEVEEYLINYANVDKNIAVSKAIMSGGSIGSALNLLDNPELDEIRNTTIEHIFSLSKIDNKNMYDFINFLKKNKENINFILGILSSCFKDILHIKHCGTNTEIINIDKKSELKHFSNKISENAAFAFCAITTKYERVIKTNANYPITMLCMVMEYWEEIHDRNYRSTIC